MTPERIIRVLNLGAGIQSTVLYLLEEYDYAIFADTQEEPKAVYQHLDWLESLGRTPILRRTAGSLGENLVHGINATGQRFVSIPAFTGATAQRGGIMRRQCTSEYKIEVVKKTLRRELLGLKPGERAGNKQRVEQSYGISLDEASRAMRIRQNWTAKWSKPRFPLLERMWSRKDCKEWLASYNIPHTVPRSACVFCPYKSNFEWRQLRDNDPEGWQRAIEIDEGMRGNFLGRKQMRQSIYLHSSCRPLKEADIDNNAFGAQYTLGFATECTGGCGL
jgi:hypothetical protein